MSFLLPFLCSCLTGYLVIVRLCKGQPVLNKTLTFILSAGLGTGLNALMTFYSFLYFDRFHPEAIRAAAFMAPPILILLNAKTLTLKIKNLSLKFHASAGWALLALGVSAGWVTAVARTHPFGDREAWLVYTMKLKFLVLGAERWKSMFSLHEYTQPDVPLLWPFINAYHAAFGQTPLSSVPFITGIIFALLTGWLVFAGLKHIAPVPAALTATVLLFTNPSFLQLATAQQADIVLAFYLLASVVCLHLALVDGHKGLAALAGLFFGLMKFTAAEGAVMAVVLLFSVIGYLFGKTGDRKKWRPLAVYLSAGFILTAAAPLIFKFYVAPPVPIVYEKLLPSALLNEITGRHWAFIWYFIILLMILANRRLFHQECKTFIFFLTVFTGIMMTGFVPARSVSSVCFELLPAVLFFVYYALYRKKEINTAP